MFHICRDEPVYFNSVTVKPCKNARFEVLAAVTLVFNAV
jgi:hypothetical protein